MTSVPKSEGGWTPGPWEVIAPTNHHGWYVEDGFGRTVCDLYYLYYLGQTGDNGKGVRRHDPRGNGEDCANARLIAAAPSLVEALRGLFEGGFIDAGTRLTDPEGRQMQWAYELEARLPAIRQALKDAGVEL